MGVIVKSRLSTFLILIGLAFSSYLPACADDFSEYMVDLKTKIQRTWTPPDCLIRDEHALVKFSITRSGDIYSVEMLEPSGNMVFDESALEALRKASPFPKFPADTARGSLTIKYSFDTAVVQTGNMQKYLEESDKYYKTDNQKALMFINLAIKEVEGDISSYFLYGKRSKIKRELGDYAGADSDMEEAKILKAKYDKKRIISAKVYAETEQSAYSYFSLAHAYDIAEDYDKAIIAIDKAISLTDLNNNYKRYKKELEEKRIVKH